MFSREKRKKIFKNWIFQLRFGIYKQGREYLCKDNEYCCLGVLCESFNLNYKIKRTNNSNIKSYKYKKDICDRDLPFTVSEPSIWSAITIALKTENRWDGHCSACNLKRRIVVSLKMSYYAYAVRLEVVFCHSTAS